MFAPPSWLMPLVAERAVLLANHVLYAEPVATAKLKPHAGKLVMLRIAGPAWPALPAWSPGMSTGGKPEAAGSEWTHALRVTAAGLLESEIGVAAGDVTDLQVALDLSQPLSAVQGLFAGQPPAMRIEGDAALATDVAWLKDNLRWDLEEDLARLFGDAWAHESMSRASTAMQGVPEAVAGWLGRLRQTPP